MDVILIQPQRYKRLANKRFQPQLGLLYIGSYLSSKGYNVKVIDGEVNSYSLNEIVQNISSPPLAVGITTASEDRFNAIELCKRLKSKFRDSMIFVGGPHFSYCAEDALINVPEIDVVVIGQGEITSYEIIDCFSKNRNTHQFNHINGCAFRDDLENIVVTPKRELIKELDKLPPTLWKLFEIDKYQGTLSVEEKTRAIGVISSRGCPYLCVFCSNSLNRTIRYRDPKLFVDEIQYLHEKYGFPGINIQDDSFTAKASQAKNICDEILTRKLRIRWYCSLRVDRASYELLSLMKEAGCVALGYGIETGSDKLLQNIKKGINTTMVREAIANTKRAGYEHVTLFYMTSLPGQTKEDVIKGSKFINEMYNILKGKTQYNNYIGNPTLIYPGTYVEKLAGKNKNVFPSNFSWNKYYETDKASIFSSNRYLPHFENLDLSLEDIKNIEFPVAPLAAAIASLWNKLVRVRSLQDIDTLFSKGVNYLKKYITKSKNKKILKGYF